MDLVTRESPGPHTWLDHLLQPLVKELADGETAGIRQRPGRKGLYRGIELSPNFVAGFSIDVLSPAIRKPNCALIGAILAPANASFTISATRCHLVPQETCGHSRPACGPISDPRLECRTRYASAAADTHDGYLASGHKLKGLRATDAKQSSNGMAIKQ